MNSLKDFTKFKKSFVEYAENVEWVLNLTSPSCADNVRKGINEVFELVYTVTGRQQLEKVFE